MYETTFVLTVLSEAPVPGSLDVAGVARECAEGDYVEAASARTSRTLTGKEMADALHAAGSEPGFFMLDDEGRRVD